MKTKTQFTNRILSIVLALVMVAGMLPTISFTASAAEYDGVIGELYYKVDQENNVTTIFGNGALSSVSSLANVMTSNVVIEEGVTSISNYAFRGLVSLEKLTVNGDVTIGNYAFQGCASLETITFMGNVTSVGRNAFQGCASLSNINYYGTTEPSYTNDLSYITLYSSNGVPFCGLTPSNPTAKEGPCSGDHTGWTELSSLTETVPGCYEIKSGGKYYLSDDVRNSTNYRPTIRITCTEEVTLCLNGKTVYHAQSPSAQVISLSDGSTLNLCDCVGTGCIVGEKEILFAYSGATINMYSGTLKDSVKEAVYLLDDASFNMYGGTITGCNTRDEDAAIISYSSAQINIYGGNISGNHKYGISSEGSIYIAGDAKITGNVEGDVYLHEGQIITVGTLTSGADIGVTSAVSGDDIAITGSNTADYSQYFHADNSSYSITNKENKIYLHKHSCAHSATENTITQRCSVCNKHTATATLTADDAVYTGAAITDTATVSYSGDAWSGDEPVLSFENNVNVGTATAKMTAGGATASTTFKINPANISYTTVTFDPSNGTYNGSAYTPRVTVTFNGATLVEDKDYTLSWDSSDLTNAGSHTATITGIGNFTGTKTATFTIGSADIKPAIVILDQNTFVYDGQPHKPTAIVTFNGATLMEGVDYEIYYMSSDRVGEWENGEPVNFRGYTSSDSINAGQYYAVVRGKGNYTTGTGFIYAAYTIEKAIVTEPTIASKPYNEVTQTADVPASGLYTVEQNNGGIDAGNYDVVLKLKDSTNYRWATADGAEITLQFKIIQARNAWTKTPNIIGWTYGKTPNTPVGEARFGTIEVLYSGTANDGTTYDSYTPPTKAGTYVAMFSVNGTANYEPIGEHVKFTIAKATYNMTGANWNYREPFRYDDNEHKVEVVGLPTGVTVESYKNNTATAVGDYYAEANLAYDADNYNAPTINKLGWTIYNDWTPTEYTVNGSGWMNKDFVIFAKSGYKVSLTNTANGTWQDALTYSAETEVGSVTFYLKNETDGTISLAKTETYKLDKTDPTGRVEFVERTGWEKFVNTITFGLFYKEEVTVKTTASDNLSGVAKIEYAYSNEAKTLDEVKTITDWTEYNGEFGVTLENAKTFVYFVRITDKAGNVTYLSTDGAEYDTTAPVLYGIENGGVYHGDKVFKATDDNFLKIEVDGVDITNTTEGDNEFKIVADNAEHTVTVTDKAGNVTEYKITVYKKYMVTYSNGDGGSYEKEFKYGEVITIPTNEFFKDTFRKTGHAIKEWHGYTEGMTMPLKDLTFTAVYVPCEYTVTFEENGGEEINPITVTFGEKYGSLPSSAITGLSGGNKNWYLVDADGNVTETNIKNLTIVSTARDHKLFIKRNVLVPSVSIALTVPGGISDGYQYYIPGASTRVLTATIGNMNTDVLDYTYLWYKDGTLIEGAASNVLTLDGNVSDSGTYKVEVTAKLKDGTNIVVGSDTATASKEQKVKILHAANTLRYDANGGEGSPQSSYTGGTILNVSKDLPTREFYDFTGWNTVPDGTGDSYKAEDAYTFANDNGNGGCEVTLYAQWKLVEYTVTYMADGESVSTETVGHGKDATLPAIPEKDGCIGKWDSDGKNITGDTTITAVYTAIPVVKPDEVKPEDKAELEDTKKQLEDMLDDDSYTDDDKKDIQDAIDDIDDALEVIGNVEEVEETISKLPAVDTVKPDDKEAIKAITDAQTAYNALSDYEKSLVDEAAKANLDKLVAALMVYDIVEGDGSSWTEDSNHNITFVVNGLFSKFVGIKVDGKDVDKANYEAKAGSTIITLKASYLDTLAVGEHTITVIYTDGETDGTFKVHAKANSPATGDNSHMMLWVALLFISGGAVITLTVVDRRRRMASNR